MKTCSGCHKEQPLSEYTKSKATKDGKNQRCKACVRKKEEARRINADALLADLPEEVRTLHNEERKLNFAYNMAEKNRDFSKMKELRDQSKKVSDRVKELLDNAI